MTQILSRTVSSKSEGFIRPAMTCSRDISRLKMRCAFVVVWISIKDLPFAKDTGIPVPFEI